ncbi:MAG TPA: M48 family metallopeptidase [Candidatus Limnocylindria bacterium]|nr:M48 family metallopeptidase [Candidatus Limnocylindria bacterium]
MTWKTPGQNIPYSIKISRRAKKMRIAVYCDSSVVVTLPMGYKFSLVEKFIADKFEWIVKSLEYFKPYKNRTIIKSGRRDYRQHRLPALELAKAKVEQWNKIYGFSYNRVNIKNQKTRWGSCSKKGNLNFNYKILRLPNHLADYLIVHELCHLKEFNHSKNFWQLVGQTMPNHKILRKELHSFGLNLA